MGTFQRLQHISNMSKREIKLREGKLKASLRWWKKLGKKEQEQLARKYRARWIPDHWIMVTKSTSTIRDIFEKEHNHEGNNTNPHK